MCLSMPAGRGTPDAPGLVLGLDQGGNCSGIAYRIAEVDVVTELALLWNREMLIGGYTPAWLELTGPDGAVFGTAVTFTIDRTHANYAGSLSHNEKIWRLATAAGSWGSSADYLLRSIAGLQACGIRDTALEELGTFVSAAATRKLDDVA